MVVYQNGDIHFAKLKPCSANLTSLFKNSQIHGSLKFLFETRPWPDIIKHFFDRLYLQMRNIPSIPFYVTVKLCNFWYWYVFYVIYDMFVMLTFWINWNNWLIDLCQYWSVLFHITDLLLCFPFTSPEHNLTKYLGLIRKWVFIWEMTSTSLKLLQWGSLFSGNIHLYRWRHRFLYFYPTTSYLSNMYTMCT